MSRRNAGNAPSGERVDLPPSHAPRIPRGGRGVGPMRAQSPPSWRSPAPCLSLQGSGLAIRDGHPGLWQRLRRRPLTQKKGRERPQKISGGRGPTLAWLARPPSPLRARAAAPRTGEKYEPASPQFMKCSLFSLLCAPLASLSSLILLRLFPSSIPRHRLPPAPPRPPPRPPPSPPPPPPRARPAWPAPRPGGWRRRRRRAAPARRPAPPRPRPARAACRACSSEGERVCFVLCSIFDPNARLPGASAPSPCVSGHR